MTDNKLMLDTLDAAINQARQAAEDEAQSFPHFHAQQAFYDRPKKLVTIVLMNEAVFAFPPHLVQELVNATEDDLSEVEISPSGQGLHWETLDVDLDIIGLLQGIFGTRAWMAELSEKGKSSSLIDQSAIARDNGKNGGNLTKSG
ncbi:MAG: DUF2442 domain-containing protein [Leptolyngbyaceae cyanobacterium]